MFPEPAAPQTGWPMGFTLRRMLGGESARVGEHRDSYDMSSELTCARTPLMAGMIERDPRRVKCLAQENFQSDELLKRM